VWAVAPLPEPTASTIIFAAGLPAVNWLCRYGGILHALLSAVATSARSRRSSTRHGADHDANRDCGRA
jgi:hypothetical protein